MMMHDERHEHPRRYRRAAWLLATGVVAGIVLSVVGIFVARMNPTGSLLYLASLALIGPSLIFLSAVTFSTYLERLEAKTYGAVYEPEESVPEFQQMEPTQP